MAASIAHLNMLLSVNRMLKHVRETVVMNSDELPLPMARSVIDQCNDMHHTAHSPLRSGLAPGNALTQSIFEHRRPEKEGRERHPSASAVKRVKKQKRHLKKTMFLADLAL